MNDLKLVLCGSGNQFILSGLIYLMISSEL